MQNPNQETLGRNKTFMYTYLIKLYRDFEREVEGGADLEPVREISYTQSLNRPDYSQKIVQQFYLLRYTYAYAFEYKQMFKTLLDRAPFGERIEVTSFGCGNAIDYWALQNTLNERNQNNCAIIYQGIDRVDWGHYRVQKLNLRKRDLLNTEVQDALEYIRQKDSLASDVFVFPKSISEFEEDAFRQFCEEFAGKRFIKDRIHILVSLRNIPDKMHVDLERSRQLAEALIQHGFQTRDDVGRHLDYEEGKPIRIRDADKGFEYPKQAYVYLQSLEDRLTGQVSDESFRIAPILKTNYAHYQVLTFEKAGKEPL